MALFKRKQTEDQPVADQIKKPEAFKVEDKKKKQPKKSTSSKADDKKSDQVAYKVLIHPLLTEKTTIQNSLNQYAFMVGDHTNKVEVKKAIQEIYHVKPVKVRIINVLGKKVRAGRRGRTTSQKNWKKAIVTIPAGKKIDVYEGV
jgi:large subunit ribosomal protein L23